MKYKINNVDYIIVREFANDDNNIGTLIDWLWELYEEYRKTK